MKPIRLVPFGDVAGALLAHLCAGLAEEFGVPCEIGPSGPDAASAYNAERGQYSSTQILGFLHNSSPAGTWRLLGVTAHDLYIPILTFVFGEAQVNGACAVVSSHRLAQEFYGLPPDPQLLSERLLKESVHELGHTLALPHCEDYSCVMAPSHTVEWIDLKSSHFCSECRARIAAGAGRAS